MRGKFASHALLLSLRILSHVFGAAGGTGSKYISASMPSPLLSPLHLLDAAPVDAIPQMVAVGVIRISEDEATPQVPLALPIGGQVDGSAGLCVSMAGSVSSVANLQQAVALRMACGVTESFLRIHAVDLVGVGACFPWLGALPQTVFSKTDLVTDPRSLTSLLSHLLDEAKARNLEKLAHRYSTLREFNAATGSSDPLHVLLISSYPAQWTEEQLVILRQVITLASRVGIWHVVHHDSTLRTGGMQDLTDMANQIVLPLTQLNVDTAEKRLDLSNTPITASLHPVWTLEPDGIATSMPVGRLDEALNRLKQRNDEPQSPDSGLRVPIGTRAGQPFHFVLGHKSNVYHALIGGTTGAGKSVLLHNIIIGLIENYTPQQVRLVLMDLKEGIEFSVYEDHPMVQHFLHGTDAGQALVALQELQSTLSARGELFREAGVNDIARYNEQNPDALLPRIVVVVDEFQKLFTGGYKELGMINALLEDLAKRGRSFGIHLIMGSQSLDRSGFDKTTRNVFGLRILLKIAASECMHFLEDVRNEAPSRFTKPGQAIYNDRGGVREGNVEIRVFNLTAGDVRMRLQLRSNPTKSIEI